MKAVVAAFNQEKTLVGAFSVITNLRMELFEALVAAQPPCNYVIRPGQAWHPWPSAQQPPAQGQTSYCCYHSLVLDSRLAAG